MPSKGKRIASRQNNLRRRRNNANRSNPPAGARATATAVAEPVPAPTSAPSASPSPASAAAPTGASRPIGRSETQPRGRRFDRPAAYNHVGSELKRIGIFSGVLVVVLVAVSFVI
ncbi:MAG: hypothetical protein OXI54_07465 [Chloroflexota bacterium]|nr:hypothetical protein [Chloroflexota bacterium]MDE2683970.1 hypothetical protein [Chloroflexota bacterium]